MTSQDKTKTRYYDFVDDLDLEAFYDAIGFEPINHIKDNDIGYCLFPGNHANGDTTGKFAIHREKKVYNCVPGSTIIATNNGPRYASTLEGRVVEVLTEGGKYRPATWFNFGERPIYKITLENGDVLYATEEHRWRVSRQKGEPWSKERRSWVTTKELVGRRIPLQCSDGNFVYDIERYRAGVLHGMIFGDGTQPRGINYTVICAWTDEDRELVREYAPEFSEYQRKGVPYTYGRKCTPNGKLLPSGYEGLSYLRGFIAGLISADGHIPEHGSPVLHQANKNILERIADIAGGCGIPVASIKLERTVSPFDGSDKPLWKLTFGIEAFKNDPNLILKESHLQNAQQWNFNRSNTHTIKVISVEFDRKEETFCCVEPETHTMTIGRGYLTGQCFVCGGGSLLSLVIELYGWTVEEATKWLRQFAIRDTRSDAEFVQHLMEMLEYKGPKPEPMPYFNERVLDKFDGPVDYFRQRCISDEVIEACRLCYSETAIKTAPIKQKDGVPTKIDSDYVGPAAIFPHFWNGQLVGWQSRWLNYPEPKNPRPTDEGFPKWLAKYTNTSSFPKHNTLFGFDWAKTQRDKVVICESVPTQLLLRSLGVPAVAYFGDAPSKEQLKLCRRFTQGVILAPDNDSNGDRLLNVATPALEPYVPVWHLPKVEIEHGDLADYAKYWPEDAKELVLGHLDLAEISYIAMNSDI